MLSQFQCMKSFSNPKGQKSVAEPASCNEEEGVSNAIASVGDDTSVKARDNDEPTAVCRISPDGNIMAANQAFCNKLGVNKLEKKSNILDYLASAEKGLLARRILLAHHHQKGFQAKLFPAAESPLGALEVNVKPEGSSLFLYEANTITVKKRKEHLPVRDTVLMAEQIPLPVLLYDKMHEAQYVNRCFLAFAGYKNKEEVLALQADVLFPAQKVTLQQLFLNISQEKATKAKDRLQLRTSSGTALWVEMVVCKIPEQDLYMAVLQDISQLKEQEEELIGRQEEMEMFMDRAFHDLKGPINSMLALYPLVEHEFIEDEGIMEYFRHYHQGITRLHRTLQDLLILSRIQQAEPVFKPLSLPQMVEECLASFRNLPSFYKIRFVKEINVQDLILTEENLLRTIVQNLLENAIKYSCEKDPEVHIMARQDKKGFWFEVSDNGIGIPKELQKKVFERFFRATTKASGSGLGLYLLQQAVAKLNGRASLHSVEGKGTSFSVYIPFR